MFGAAAYIMWGAFPLYFPLMEPAGAWEILGHRIVWSLVVAGALVLIVGRRQQVAAILRDRRKLGLAVVSTPLVRRRDLSRSKEHTSELQSLADLVCRLLLEKKNI